MQSQSKLGRVIVFCSLGAVICAVGANAPRRRELPRLAQPVGVTELKYADVLIQAGAEGAVLSAGGSTITLDKKGNVAIKAAADLKLDGTDIMPVMTGRAPKLERDLFWRQREQKAIRSGKWKLVLNARGGGDGEARGLFDLESDLSESKNLAGDHPDIADELEKKLAAWEADVSAGEMLS